LELTDAGLFPQIKLRIHVRLHGRRSKLRDRLEVHQLPDLSTKIQVPTGLKLLVGPPNTGQRFAFEVCADHTHMNVLEMTKVDRIRFLRESTTNLHKYFMATPQNTAILIEILETDTDKFKQRWRDLVRAFIHKPRRYSTQYMIIICEPRFAETMKEANTITMFPGNPQQIAQMLALHVEPPENNKFETVISVQNQLMLIANRITDYYKVDEVLAAHRGLRLFCQLPRDNTSS
jgi:hypothetical protein